MLAPERSRPANCPFVPLAFSMAAINSPAFRSARNLIEQACRSLLLQRQHDTQQRKHREGDDARRPGDVEQRAHRHFRSTTAAMVNKKNDAPTARPMRASVSGRISATVGRSRR